MFNQVSGLNFKILEHKSSWRTRLNLNSIAKMPAQHNFVELQTLDRI